jgi:hypothetical protein
MDAKSKSELNGGMASPWLLPYPLYLLLRQSMHTVAFPAICKCYLIRRSAFSRIGISNVLRLVLIFQVVRIPTRAVIARMSSEVCWFLSVMQKVRDSMRSGAKVFSIHPGLDGSIAAIAFTSRPSPALGGNAGDGSAEEKLYEFWMDHADILRRTRWSD